MSLQFTKMQGLGNDFMVLDSIRQSVSLDKNRIATLADRHTGIGFDQCLLIEAAKDESHDFFYRIFNANGEEVGQCGNGARCLALYVKQYGLTHKTNIRVATPTTGMTLQINDNNTVSVHFAKPELEPALIPFVADKQADIYRIPILENEGCTIHALNVGNPHAITLVDDINMAPVATTGKALSTHVLFPEQVNAGFMQILSNHHIQLRVYERGCGETLACGSGAVAAAAAGRLFHGLEENITVSLPGGDLHIFWPDLNQDLILTGPGVFVYEGIIL